MIGANTLQGSMKFIDKMGQISIFNLKWCHLADKIGFILFFECGVYCIVLSIGGIQELSDWWWFGF